MGTLQTRIDLRATADVAELAHGLQLELGGVTHVPTGLGDRVSALLEAVGRVDGEWFESLDPVHQTALMRAAFEISMSAHLDAEAARRQLMLGLQRLAEVLDRIAEGQPAAPSRSAQQVALWLATVVDAPQAEIAELAGVSVRTFGRWVSGRTVPDGEEARRLRLVASLVAQLRFSLTPVGVLRWFDWPNVALGDRCPREVIDVPEMTPELFRAAARLRSSVAA